MTIHSAQKFENFILTKSMLSCAKNGLSEEIFFNLMSSTYWKSLKEIAEHFIKCRKMNKFHNKTLLLSLLS